MKILNKLGLKNPSIEIIVNSQGQRHISLIATDVFINQKSAKRFSFFQEVFDNFLLERISNNLADDLQKIIKAEMNKDEIPKDTPVKAVVIGSIESDFEMYIENNLISIESNLKKVLDTAFPKITFKKNKIIDFLQATKEEEETGLIFYMVSNEDVAKKRAFDEHIYDETEIHSLIGNICYKNKINAKNITLYYYIATKEEIEKSTFPPRTKEALLNDFIKVTLIPLSEYYKNNSKRIITLHLLNKIDNDNENNQQKKIGVN